VCVFVSFVAGPAAFVCFVIMRRSITPARAT